MKFVKISSYETFFLSFSPLLSSPLPSPPLPSLPLPFPSLPFPQFQEFHAYAVNVGPTEETLHVKDCINWFNGLSLWTQSSILRQRSSVAKRARTLMKFIDVAKQLCELNSLNTALAVIGGLQHSSIKRLTATWAELPRGTADVSQCVCVCACVRACVRAFVRIYVLCVHV